MRTQFRNVFVLPAFLSIVLLSAKFNPAYGIEAARTVTLEEAYDMAASTHEMVRISEEGITQAEAVVGKAMSTILPQLGLEAGYTRYSEKQTTGAFVTQPDVSKRLDVRFSQSLYTGGIEWSAIRQGRLLIEKNRERHKYSRQSVLLQTARAYYGALKAERDVDIRQAALKRAEERKKAAYARFKVGEVTRSAVLRAEAEVSAKEAEFIKAGSSLLDAKNMLKRVIGSEGEVNVAEPARQAMAAADADTLVKASYEARLDYKQAIIDKKLSEESITYAKGNFLPRLRLEGQYSLRAQDPETAFFQEDSASASIVLTYPLFEGGLRKAEMNEVLSRRREAELRLQSLRKDMEIEVRAAFNAMEAQKAVIEAYRKRLSFAEEDYKTVFEQFKHGLATTVDVIDAGTELQAAEGSLMNSVYDLELAIVSLKYSVGIHLEDVAK
ncbi:MAG: TolC family protein [Deltaproteobacteria bacterium]|nr:TolC family protein [Deltaproteobacteria bacterium]